MTPQTPSGQQAVELKPCPFCGGMAQRTDVPTDDESDPNAGGSFIECRECAASTALHFDRKENLIDSWNQRAAPTAPSTAAGEMAFVCGCGWDGSYADLNETVEGMTCPKCRLGRNLDCAAALATPPAQGVEEENETLENLIDAAIGARTTPPWQEQAAQIRRDALEEAAKICDEMYVTFSSSMSPDRKNNKSWAMAANALADKIRALVRSEKGEGK